MEEQFDKAAVCKRRLQELLKLNAEDSIQRGLLEAFVNLCEQDVNSGCDGTPEVMFGRWIVRGDDLSLFSVLRSAVTTLAGSSFVFNNLTTSGVTALVVAVTELLWSVYRAAGRVTPRQAAILAIMKQAGQPVTVEYIFSQPTPGGDLEWSREKIEEELQSLRQIVTRRGVQKMVEHLSNDRWALNGA